MSSYFTFSREELENKIRKLAMQEMLAPSYGDADQTIGYNVGIPYYNDGVLNMAETMIRQLMPEDKEDADAAT